MVRRPSTALRKTLRFLKGHRTNDVVVIPDQVSESGRFQKIPLAVYQTAESRSVHPLHAKSIGAFRALNPELSFQLFDGPTRDRYMARFWGNHPVFEIYQRSVFGQMKADIFRYCIIWERGGYYFDFNKGCAVPLTSLHPADADGLVTAESNPVVVFPRLEAAQVMAHPENLYAQWGFGFRAQHPVLRAAIDRIVEIEPFFRGRSYAQPKVALLTMSATGLFTDVLRSFFAENGPSGIEQSGIDFNGHGIFRLKGAKIQMARSRHYSTVEDSPIVQGFNSGQKAGSHNLSNQ